MTQGACATADDALIEDSIPEDTNLIEPNPLVSAGLSSAADADVA